MTLLLFNHVSNTFKKRRKTSQGSNGKGHAVVVKMRVENKSLFICWEKRDSVVFITTNLFRLSNKQNIIVYLDILSPSVYLAFGAGI